MSPDKKDDENVGTTGARTTPPDISLNSGAYVLDALSPSERQEFEAHLEESEATRNEVTELSDTAVLLGLAVTPVQPSPELKTNLMAMLASTPQLSRDIAPVRTLKAVPDVDPDVLVDPETENETDDGTDIRFAPAPVQGNAKAKARWFNRPIVALTAVAAAAALVLGGGAIANVVNDSTFNQQQADALAQITSASDSQQADAAVSTGGTATLVWSHELGKSALIMKNMAELPAGKTYELWYINTAGEATKAGLVSDGSDNLWRVLDGNISEGDTVGVTVEPSSGSDAPTTTPIVAIASA